MQKKGFGRVITIGSVQQDKPHPDMLIYSANKCAVKNIVQSLALQLAKENITVNNLAVGTIYTDRNKDVLKDAEYLKKVENDIPVGFIGEPRDCAGMALLLASEEGRYITGEDIHIDGGKFI
jgi:NAD(P)-dependent dehydrogenase (short-subunit alcohol dehydrogenase family)